MRSDMNQAYKKSLNTDNNISLTGYRSLFLLMELLKSAKTREELLYCFSKDPIIKSNLSKDTVTNTINALKAAGCVISRPTQKTENKYVLKSHPFIIRLSKENVQLLLAIRESIVTLGDWQLLINLNNLYAKIALLAPDWDSQRMLLYEHPFKYINSQIFSAILLNSKLKKHLMVCYNSPENGEENIIKKVGGTPETKKHLEDLGFVPGGAVTVVTTVGGNLIVNIKESRVAISREMASKIMI